MEAEEYIRKIEQQWSWKFPEGYNTKIKSIRLSEDPVLMYHRPMFWYFVCNLSLYLFIYYYYLQLFTNLSLFLIKVISILDLRTYIQLRTYNFRHLKSLPPKYRQQFPLSLSQLSPTSKCSLSYWYKPPHPDYAHIHSSPLVLSHGIGIGLHTYLPLLRKLSKEYPHIPVFCIENLHVSMRVVSDVPSKDEVCEGIKIMLNQEGTLFLLFY